MNKPTITTMGQGTAERYEPKPRSLCISITCPTVPLASLRDGWASVLRLQFIDDQWNAHMKPHDYERIAAKVLEYLIMLTGKIDHIVIHCTVGVSRSVSLAQAIRVYYGIPCTEDFILNAGLFNGFIATLKRSRGDTNVLSPPEARDE